MTRFTRLPPGWLILLIVVLTACGGTTRMAPLAPLGDAGAGPDCRGPFVRARWQFVHAIRMDVAGRSSFFNGVIDVDPNGNAIRCTLLTLEGLVLFDARLAGTAAVMKAIPPFDRPALATGILADVALIFLPPQGNLRETGRTTAGTACRFVDARGGVVEVATARDGTWRIRKYDDAGRMTREVISGATGRKNTAGTLFIPDTFSLTAPGTHGYSLHFRLLSATPINH